MGPVRMISSGHELTTDYDEKALHELGFKDMQVGTSFMVSVLIMCALLAVSWLIEDLVKLLIICC